MCAVLPLPFSQLWGKQILIPGATGHSQRPYQGNKDGTPLNLSLPTGMGVKSGQEVETLAFHRTQARLDGREELILGNVLLIKSLFSTSLL